MVPSLNAYSSSELLVSAVNNDAVLQQNLLSSPSVASGDLPIRLYQNHPSASRAYNNALSESEAEIVIFAHQDVYLPERFIGRLRIAVTDIAGRDPAWAVLGVFGAAADGRRFGRVWCSAHERELGGPFTTPGSVVSLDELLLVVRRSSGLRFDETLPGFHLYGTDIVQAALAGGFGAYVVHAPVVHNSNPTYLWRDYWKAYRHVARRWRHRLPIRTCILPITTNPWPEIHYRAYQRWELLFGPPPIGKRRSDPAAIAKRLAY